MNVIRLIFILFLQISVIGVYSQAPGRAPAKRPKKEATVQANTLLWEISGKNLKTPSYLFGTMHMLCDSEAVVSDSLSAVIARCSRVYFEIDMDNMQEMMGVLKYIKMNDGQKLSELLSPEEYQRVTAYFGRLNVPMPMSMIDRMKPMFTSSLVSEQLIDCPKKTAMEQVIMMAAKNHEAEILGLESAAFQASLFDSIPYKEQARELLEYIDSIDVYRKNSEEMMRIYRQQDLGRLDSIMRKSDPGLEQYMDLLLYGRNRKWVQQMPGMMLEGSTLFAVGAGHLVGDKGVIALLRKEGYRLRPVPNRW